MKSGNLSRSSVAIDLGATSGRVTRGEFDGHQLTLQEAHRFPNRPISEGGELRWNIPELTRGIETGISRATSGSPIDSIGLDTWGVDYGIITADGQLAANPWHYRDERTTGLPERIFREIPAADVYATTGSQTIRFNTLFQMVDSLGRAEFDHASRILLLPDLFAWLFTKIEATEATIASTTQLFDPRVRTWASQLIDRLGLDNTLLADVHEPGSILGPITPDFSIRTNLSRNLPFVSVASHDTASAVVATDARPDVMWISSGTWSLVGIETSAPVISEAARQANFTNEAGAEKTNRFLRNSCGLWLVEQCRNQWATQGFICSHEEATHLAASSGPFPGFIDPDNPGFLLPDDMPQAINNYLVKTGQPPLTSRGAILRCALESLTLNYRAILEDLRRIAERPIRTIQIVGGGSQNDLLCQLTADATGLPVLAGPIEATAIGNLMVQAQALGEIETLSEIREVTARSFPFRMYEPSGEIAIWDAVFNQFRRLKNRPD